MSILNEQLILKKTYDYVTYFEVARNNSKGLFVFEKFKCDF